jgi:hypothetical protein
MTGGRGTRGQRPFFYNFRGVPRHLTNERTDLPRTLKENKKRPKVAKQEQENEETAERYEPLGKQWEKEMMRFTKSELIQMLKEKYKEKKMFD